MRKFTLILFIGIILFISDIYSQTPGYEWSRQAGGVFNEQGYGISADEGGNAYITGEYRGNISFGNNVTLQSSGGSGDIDYFLVKLNSAGDAVWARKGGGTSADRGFGVKTNGKDVYTAGAYSKTATFEDTIINGNGNQLQAFLTRYDSAGTLIWIKEGKCTTQVAAKAVAIDNFNNVIVCGYYGTSSSANPTAIFDNDSITSAGKRDIYLAKYTEAGELLWVKSAGGIFSDEQGEALAVDASGNIYVGGIVQDSSYFGNILIRTLNQDAFLAKYDSDGNVQWVKTGSGKGNDALKGISIDESGNIYSTGYFDSSAVFNSTKLDGNDGYDIFIAKYNPDGDLLWINQASSSNYDYCYAIDANANGCVITGKFMGTITFGNIDIASTIGSDDIFIARYNASGNLNWVKQIGGSDDEVGNAIDIDDEENIYVTGKFKSVITLDATTLTATGDDIFVIKLGNPAVPVELAAFNSSVSGKSIRLEWSSVTETNNAKYEIERSTDNADFVKIGSVPGHGTTSEKHFYSFIDEDIMRGEYYYRLKQIDYDGTFTYSKVLKTSLNTPGQFALHQNYPNPFNPETIIQFELPSDASVSIKVFNMIGQELASPITNQFYSEGTYHITFNAEALSSGMYLYTLRAMGQDGQEFSSSRKMTVIK